MTIYCGDAVKWANDYRGPLHHAMLCDCPYHLASIVKRFGGKDAVPAQEGTDGAFRRMSKGFMGADWDGVDQDGNGVAMKPETWAAFAKVLYPGAFLLVFAGCLNDDAISMAMREAGLIKHHSLHWAFGSGFPKATRIDTQIDREAGAERELTGEYDSRSVYDGKQRDSPKAQQGGEGYGSIAHTAKIGMTEPVTDLARAWVGHRYGRQSIKPAVETILLFQVPYKGRPLDCITTTGAGALNIEAGRIRGTAGIRREDKPRHGGVFAGNQTRPYIEQALAAGVPARATYETAEGGRWPANLILDEEAGAMVDRQSGTSSEKRTQVIARQGKGTNGIYGDFGSDLHNTPSHPGAGGCSRFFFRVQTQIDEADPILYRAKSGNAERNAGLDRFARQAVAEWPQRLDGDDERGEAPRSNNHPTVKPLSLCRYLASLLLPPAEYAPRRLYVPFSGVSSEMCGADLAGWEQVNGVEQDAGYCAIGEARRKFWSCHSGLFESLCEQPEEETEMAQGTLDWTDE